MAGGKQLSYQYVKLAEAKTEGTSKSYNVFGVVTFFKVPRKTQGTDYCMTVSITDESLPEGEKIVCTLFYRLLDKFPPVSVGDVVRFHRLVVEEFRDEPKGKPGHGFAWLVVGSDTDKPAASSEKFTYTDENKKRVQELKAWAATHGLIKSTSITTISSLIPRAYCDLVCQVIGTCVEEERVSFVARVWDGTRPVHPTVNTLNRLEQVDSDLDSVTSEMSVDVWLFDDHFETGLKMKPGQYIKLCNLHAVIHKEAAADNPDDVAFPTLELTIHRGTSFGRGVVFLDTASPEAVALRQRLETVSVDMSSRPDQLMQRTSISAAGEVDAANPQPGCSHDGASSPQECPETTHVAGGESRSVELQLTSNEEENMLAVEGEASEMSVKTVPRSSGGGDTAVALPSSAEECMLQTATVITGHQPMSRTPLAQVQSHSVPYKFRVLASLVDFHPNCDDSSQFVQLLCPQCSHLQKVDENSSENGTARKSTSVSSLTSKLAKFLGGGFANWNQEKNTQSKDVCPHCSTDQEPVQLEPIFMLRLLLQDNSGHLVANLWRKEAVTFFRGLKPDTALRDSGIFQDIISTLRSLCLSHPSSSSASASPKLDCCLSSYSAHSGVNFHIFDTELV